MSSYSMVQLAFNVMYLICCDTHTSRTLSVWFRVYKSVRPGSIKVLETRRIVYDGMQVSRFHLDKKSKMKKSQTVHVNVV